VSLEVGRSFVLLFALPYLYLATSAKIFNTCKLTRSFSKLEGSGFVGQRLVEMLVERGAKYVVSFDRYFWSLHALHPETLILVVRFLELSPLLVLAVIFRAPTPKGAMECPEIKYVQGDLTKKEDVVNACEGVDCVFHIAALVGPYYPDAAYEAVNYGGTVNVIEACKAHKVPKLV
jgi:nucleoside-diphosphate-sugar epimerase